MSLHLVDFRVIKFGKILWVKSNGKDDANVAGFD